VWNVRCMLSNLTIVMNPYLAYFILVLIAGLGILQIIADIRNLKSLLFSKSHSLTRAISVILIILCLVAFFLGEDYFHSAPIQGAEQTGLFSLALFSGLIVTYGIGSLIHRKNIPPDHFTPKGLESMRQITFFQAIRRKTR
jgi:hypothetical protein